MKLSHITFAAVFSVALTLSAFAQPGPGGGMRGSMGGAYNYGFDKSDTTGWTLMTEAE